MALGSELRQRREESGMTLDSLSARTKIPIRILNAIERDDFSSVPQGIFVRGYVRALAGTLQMDPDAVVRRFTQEHQPPPSLPDAPPPATLASDDEGRTLPRAARVIVVALAAIAAYAMWTSREPAGEALDPRGAPQRDAVAPSESRAVGTSGRSVRDVGAAVPAAARPGSTAPEQLEITLETSRRVWISATADGRRALHRLLDPGERVSLTGFRRVDVRTGDAGAVRYVIGDRAPLPMGRNGEVRTVTFVAKAEGVEVR